MDDLKGLSTVVGKRCLTAAAAVGSDVGHIDGEASFLAGRPCFSSVEGLGMVAFAGEVGEVRLEWRIVVVSHLIEEDWLWLLDRGVTRDGLQDRERGGEGEDALHLDCDQ
ncbi:hypothetical protein ABW21_db0206480 [Orbilia brochopaga]|nr:hypothetical protein ABW21_db0206480 [Drechslerella brochopaga]